MNDNVDIFIGAYKDFVPRVTNDAYKIIVGNHDISVDSSLEVIKCGSKDDVLDDRFYSEIYMLKWVADNLELKKYVGYCHYRKYFSFMDNIPDLDEIFESRDVVAASPIKQKYKVIGNYSLCHNVDDLLLAGEIIRDEYPEYSSSYINVMKSNQMFPYNMFIMKKEDFIEYINFICGVLESYVNRVGTDIEGRILSNKDKYLEKRLKNNNTVEYQYRIGGYLAERLTNVFMHKRFNIARTYKVIITENKVNDKENEKRIGETGKCIEDEGKSDFNACKDNDGNG